MWIVSAALSWHPDFFLKKVTRSGIGALLESKKLFYEVPCLSSLKQSTMRIDTVIHAEMTIMNFILQNYERGNYAVGVSKACCLMCRETFQTINGIRTTKFYYRQKHDRYFPNWRLPQIDMSYLSEILFDKVCSQIQQFTADPSGRPQAFSGSSVGSDDDETTDTDWEAVGNEEPTSAINWILYYRQWEEALLKLANFPNYCRMIYGMN